ncbi:MAG: GTPase [Candidatus Hydrothermota bacterium]|nr:MAG: GTPase [Candidatus Hydrothermae bacterium]RKZ04688.1 MAG: GTPase [Candidatus Hydrothermae bacterium]
MEKKRVLIMGAAGRDFHNFNVCFRDNEAFEVVGFTATQIPDIEGRLYPPELAGSLYPQGIPIYPEEDLEKLIVEKDIDIAVFSYSDVSHEYVMHRASRAIAAGADFLLLGSKGTMVKSQKPVISVCAVRTGSGKSQTTRRVAEILKKLGKKTAVIRHPMPYGDLRKQVVQRFASYEDLDRHNCTIEEREEYEPHIDRGNVVYAGVDYGKILAEAEKEADVILWDGGNNDLPFYRPDLHIVVADPLRPYHEVTYHPGEANLRMADVVVINKIDSAYPEDVQIVRENIIESNPKAIIIEAASPIVIDDGDMIRGKRVLVVEDGPTLTHGEMSFGAGVVAAQKYGAAELVDPRENAVGTIKETFEKYPQIGQLLPAVGYSDKQLRDLEETINRTQADLVVVATPIDLGRVIKINKPYVRVRYDLQEIGTPDLEEIIRKRFGW